MKGFQGSRLSSHSSQKEGKRGNRRGKENPSVTWPSPAEGQGRLLSEGHTVSRAARPGAPGAAREQLRLEREAQARESRGCAGVSPGSSHLVDGMLPRPTRMNRLEGKEEKED